MKIEAVIDDRTPDICRAADGSQAKDSDLPHDTGDPDNPCRCVGYTVSFDIGSPILDSDVAVAHACYSDTAGGMGVLSLRWLDCGDDGTRIEVGIYGDHLSPAMRIFGPFLLNVGRLANKCRDPSPDDIQAIAEECRWVICAGPTLDWEAIKTRHAEAIKIRRARECPQGRVVRPRRRLVMLAIAVGLALDFVCYQLWGSGLVFGNMFTLDFHVDTTWR